MATAKELLNQNMNGRFCFKLMGCEWEEDFFLVVVVANLVVRRRGIDTLLRRAEGRDFHDS